MAEDTRSGAAAPLVSGADIRTFLFADMRGYTRYTQEHGDDAASALAGRFADLVKATVPGFEGELLELRGDEALCVFRSARQALRASVELQRRLRTGSEEEPAFPIGVGMGLDAGEAVPTHGGYRGASLNLAARLCALAKPGETLASETVIGLASRVDGMRFLEGRSATLKGLARPVRYVVVEPVTPMPPAPVTKAPPRRRWYVAAATAVIVVAVVVIVAVRSSHTNQASGIGELPRAGIVRVSAAGGKQTVMPVRPRPDAVQDLAWGYGWVWITTPEGLSRVNPATGHIDASVGLTGCPGCTGAPLAIGLGRVFVTGGGEGSNNVQVIDPQSPTAVEGVIPTEPFIHTQGAFYIAAGFRSIWVWPSGGTDYCCDGRMFWRIDPTTGRRLARWFAPNLSYLDYTNVEHAVAVGAGAVWFLRDNQLSRIEPSTNRITGGFKTRASMITTAAGAVWTITDGTVITEINPALFPRPSAVIWTHTLPGYADSIAADGGLVWIVDGLTHHLILVNATSRHISQRTLPRTGHAQLAAGHGAAWLGYPSPAP